MNPDNDRIRAFLGVDKWHAAGYTGKRAIAGSGEDFANSAFPAHPFLTASVFHEIAPDAELLVLPADGYENETFMTDSINAMMQKQVCVWFYSVQSDASGVPMEAAFEKAKDFCAMFNAAGNSYDKDYAHLIDAPLIYGVGAYLLMADGTVNPEADSSISEYVDFCAPANFWVNGAFYTGTSFSNAALAGMAALINDMAIDKTGKPLSSAMMYQCLKDNSHDFYTPGKDPKTGWGYVTLPDPSTFDISKYVPKEVTENMTVKASDIVNKALEFLGVKESPPNSNNVQFNTDFYGHAVSGSNVPWCCAFVWDVFRLAGASSLFYGGGKVAYCPALENYAKARGQWVTDDYKPGDCVLYNWEGGSLAEHIGIVEVNNGDGTITAIEGNTGTGSNSDGGEVMRRVRNTSVILGAYRPLYAAESEDDMTDDRVNELIAEALKKALPTYASISDVPTTLQAETRVLLDANAINGGTDAKVNPDDVNLTQDALKAAIIAKRYVDSKVK
jgi:hypothetical protein